MGVLVSKRDKNFIIIITIFVFTIFLIYALPIIGNQAGIFNIIPIIIIAWFYDIRGGFISGFLGFPYVMFIDILLFDVSWKILIEYQGISIIIAETIIGITVGLLSKLRKKLNNEILERKKVEEKLTYYANLDALTNILNRRAGLEILNKEIKKSKENKYDLSISFFDINSLKIVNDTYGHDEGDFLIKTVIGKIKDNISPEETLVRLGGDEFLLIMPYKNIGLAKEQVTFLKLYIEEINFQHKKPYKISVSFGIEEYHSPISLDEFIKSADSRMYEEKVKYYNKNIL